MPATDLNLFSPAKINLFLAVTGRREDGYHNLLSVAAPLGWGDRLKIRSEAAPGDTLECDDPAVPTDASNLVLRAAQAFRAATGWTKGARFRLEKRIPVGAGLGGGSSNAVAALRGLNTLAGKPLGGEDLAGLATRLGSDCAQFLHDGPVVMRGRGEIVEPFPAAARLRGLRLAVMKPGFGVGTAWAYSRIRPAPPAAAEGRLSAWLEDGSAGLGGLLRNDFEPVAFAKFPCLPLLLERLRSEFGLAAGMSGSGSACFALLAEGAPPAEALAAEVRRAWGPSALFVETEIPV